MCAAACFDIGYKGSDICDNEGDTVYTAPCSCYLFHCRSRRVYAYNGCLAWYDVLLNPRITQA